MKHILFVESILYNAILENNCTLMYVLWHPWCWKILNRWNLSFVAVFLMMNFITFSLSCSTEQLEAPSSKYFTYSSSSVVSKVLSNYIFYNKLSLKLSFGICDKHLKTLLALASGLSKCFNSLSCANYRIIAVMKILIRN